ncbi:MAG: hypothetical protein KDN18_06080 [Verrucomicrobiae bacterium]|nr:hypothetical protein [Verrucomicrobiae bacterium]
MKMVSAFFGIALFVGLVSPASAQISENDASVAALAVQCAMSSGYSPEDYEEYCRRLAKTLGMLSGEQQTRVFGYLPQPVAATAAGSLATIGNATAGSTTANSTSTTETSGNIQASTNGLVDLVGTINSLLDGTASVQSSTVVAGSTLDPNASNTTTVSVAGTTASLSASTGSGSSGGLAAFLNWLKTIF